LGIAKVATFPISPKEIQNNLRTCMSDADLEQSVGKIIYAMRLVFTVLSLICLLLVSTAVLAQDSTFVVHSIEVKHQSRSRTYEIKPGRAICVGTIQDTMYLEGVVKSVGYDFIEVQDRYNDQTAWTVPLSDIDYFALRTADRMVCAIIGTAAITAAILASGLWLNDFFAFGSWKHFWLQEEDNKWGFATVTGAPDDYFEPEYAPSN
jgi:hypothetical protein